jgi:hypothetical protein
MKLKILSSRARRRNSQITVIWADVNGLGDYATLTM